MRLVEIEPGLAIVEQTVVTTIMEEAILRNVPVYVLSTGTTAGSESFFNAVRASLPLDPPLVSARSWDALSDSLWEGVYSLESNRAVIVWPDAWLFKEVDPATYELTLAIFRDVIESLDDFRATNGRPKQLSVYVGERQK